MADRSDYSSYLTHDADGTASMRLAVEGVHCAACITRIESGLKALPGLIQARLNFTDRRLTAKWREGALEPAQLFAALDRLGYRALPFRPHQAEEQEGRTTAFLLRCLAVAGFAAMNIMLLSVSVWSGNAGDINPETRDLFHWVSAIIAIPAAAYAGRPFFSNAWQALRVRSVNMDVPISLGVILALGMSLVETANHARHAYFDSAVMLLFFLLAGRTMDHLMRRRARAAAGNLAALKGETARRIGDNGELVTVPASALVPGDHVLLRQGDRVPADVCLLTGKSSVDESMITGETMARTVGENDLVFAGSLNLSGVMTARVVAAGTMTLIDEVERLLGAASVSRSRYVKLADRAAQMYAPVVHTAAALTFIGWMLAGASAHDAIVAAISVLIITCPCALALAVPAVQVAAAGTLFKNGILINNGDALERLAGIDTVVFDKTGTLTLPEPVLANAADISPVLMQLAAQLALSSHHPLAQALARQAIVRTPLHGAQEIAGQGVSAIVDGQVLRLGSPAFCGFTSGEFAEPEAETSIIAFCAGGQRVVLNVRQSLRPDALATVTALRARGLKLHILSGDRQSAVAGIARTLGIEDYQAGVNPAGKTAAIAALRAAGHKVLMVGDGLNDAPALASANVSMSPVSAVDLTQAQADLLFMGERLGPVLVACVQANKAGMLMQQNLVLSVAYNAIAVPLAVAGLVTPLIAALAMSLSSILVTVNALRARFGRIDDVVALQEADEAEMNPAIPFCCH